LFDLKTLYKGLHKASSRRARWKQRYTKIEPEPVKIGGENSAGATVGGISTFSNISIVITMMKRE
jgi:hypothetical protein